MKGTNIRSLLFANLILFNVLLVSGVASYPGIIQYEQPDGSKIEVLIHGDDRFHWYTTPSGEILQADETGELVPGKEEYAKEILNKKGEVRNSPRSYTQYPTTGVQKSMIILVEFSDRAMTYGLNDFEDMLNSTGYSKYGSAGSARDYFIENSSGKFTPEFDVRGPVKLSHTMSYYGSDNDSRAHEMIYEACKSLENEVNFRDYDCDGDGWVDNIYVFYAGYGEADGGGVNSVWPHSANLYRKGVVLTLNGVGIGSYSCSNELVGGSTRLVGIGTFCHEFSHVLGLPDLYSTNDNNAFTPYYYSLMDHGNYNGDGRVPCSLTSYEREYLGWGSAMELVEPGSRRLEPLRGNHYYRISLPGFEEEYYLLEYRRKEGWDASLPGEGMLIWHIDYNKDVWDRNAVNNDEGRQRVDLIEADGIKSLGSSAGDPFPGTSGTAGFSDIIDHTGTRYNHALLNIRHLGDAIEFDYDSSGMVPEAVKGLYAEEVEDTSFILSWDPESEADSYLVTIQGEENGRMRPLGDYTSRQVSETSISVEGLDPEQRYICTVRGVKGSVAGKSSRELEVRTSEPGIGYYSPVALEAEEIGPDGFTACWEDMTLADSYLVDIYTKGEETLEKEMIGFSTPLSLPVGWVTTVISTMSVNGYYGESAPSLRFTNNAESIESPEYENGITGVSFWVRGYKAPESAALTLYVNQGGTWKEVSRYASVSNTTGEIKEWEAAENETGISAIRIVYENEGTGSICIDDLTLNFGTVEVRVPVIDKAEVLSGSKYRAEGLNADTEYSYVITGRRGEKLSKPSEEIKVRTLKSLSSVKETILNGDRYLLYDISGKAIPEEKKESGKIYIEKRGETYEKIIER